LIGAAFRDGRWLIATTVLLGVLLLQFGYSLIEPALVILLRTQRPYSSAHVDAYMFFLNNGIMVGRGVLPFVVGCIVALAAKEREMVSAMTLSTVCVALNALGLMMSWANGHRAGYSRFVAFLGSNDWQCDRNCTWRDNCP